MESEIKLAEKYAIESLEQTLEVSMILIRIGYWYDIRSGFTKPWWMDLLV